MSAWYRRRWVLVSLGTFAALALALTLLLATPLGLRLGLAFVPPGVTVAAVRGGLLTAFELDALVVDTSGARIAVDTLRVDPAFLPLLRGEVRVQAVESGAVDVLLRPTDEPEPAADAEPFEPPVIELPVAIALERLAAGPLTLRSAGEGGAPAELLRLETLALTDLDFADGLAALGELAVAHASGELRLAGTARAAPPFDLALNADGAWEDDLTGTLVVAGDQREYTLGLTTDGAVDTRFSGRVSDAFGEPRLALELAANIDALSRFLEAPPVESAAIEIEGEAGLRSVDLVTYVQLPGLNRLRLEKDVDIDLDAGRVEIRRFELREIDAPGELRASGTVGLDPEAPLNLLVSWQDLARIRLDAAGLHSETGRVALSGTLEDLLAELSLAFDSAHAGGTVEGRLRHRPGEVAIDRVEVAVLDGRVGLTGRVGYGDAVTARGRLVAEALDLATFLGQPAHLDLGADFDVAVPGNGPPTAQVALTELSGTVAERSLSGGGRIALEGDAIRIDDFAVAVGDNRMAVRGFVGNEIDVLAELDAPALTQLLPELAGRVSGRIEASGARTTPTARIVLDGVGLRYDTVDLERLDLEADLALDEQGRNTVRLVLGGLRAAGREVQSATLDIDGTRAVHRGALAVDAAVATLGVGWEGGLAAERYAGRVDELELAPEAYAPLTLVDPTPFELSAARQALGEPLCLAGPAGRLCLSVRRDQDAVAGGLELAQLDLTTFGGLVDEAAGRPMNLSGEASGHADFESEADGWRVDAALRTPHLTVQLAPAGDPLVVGERGLELEARMSPQAIDLALTADLLPTGRLEASVDGAGLGPDDPIEGRLFVDADDLGAFQPLLGEVSDLTGAARVEAVIGGTVSAPAIVTEARVTGLGAGVPPLGLALSEGNVALDIDEAGTGTLEASIRSGEGELTVTSEFAAARQRAVLTVLGENFEGMDSEQIRALVSPTLAVRVSPEELAVNGTVEIPTLLVDLTALEGSVSRSPDVVVVGREEEAGGLPLALDVQVILGDDVRLAGFGVDGQLTGKLRVTERPGRAMLCSGQITVAGGLQAYGQDLRIRRGRLLFSGTPCEDPVLEIEAIREIGVDDAIAGVRVGGTASFPELTLFSNPAREESEALCMLVTGKSCGVASGGDVIGDAMLQAGLSAGSAVTNQIGQQAGLDDFSLTSSDEFEGAGMTVGKYIAEKVYVSYGRSFSNNVQFFETAYDITDRLRVAVRQALETITSVRYEIELD